MKYESLFQEFPIVVDVIYEYISLRRAGFGRNSTVDKITETYSAELEDEDDAPCVYMGIAIALLHKKELLYDIAVKASECIDYFCKYDHWSKSRYERLIRLRSELMDSGSIGPEAEYAKRTYLRPDWKVGDTFAHIIQCQKADVLGIKGYYLLMRKIGEYKSSDGKYNQLVYITICPPDKLPNNTDELHTCGYIPMLPVSYTHSDYMAQVVMEKKADEAKLGLTKIGCFPDAGDPANQANTDYRTCKTIFCMVDESGIPLYENSVCMNYKKYGIIKP